MKPSRRLWMLPLLLIGASPSFRALELSDFTNKAKEIANFTAETGIGVAKKIPDVIPSAEEIFDLSKQALAGLPFEAVASAINKICSIALSANATKPAKMPNMSELSYVLLTENENVSIPLENAHQLWSHRLFNPQLKVVILVTGWNTDLNETNDAISGLWDAYRSRGDTNFITIDTARYVDTLYTWSAFNTQDLGEALGTGLADLVNFVPLEKIHLIGHSLGSHISGAAGRKFQHLTGTLLPRITGLDPANPCFREGESLIGLMRGDADFVDVIHTNNGVLGKRDPIADADFYPNGIVSLQPGCWTIFCSHSRAWELFAETVYPGNENNFLAIKCNSINSLDSGACPGNEIPVGFACPKEAKGNFFFKTESEAPFSRRLSDKIRQNSANHLSNNSTSNLEEISPKSNDKNVNSSIAKNVSKEEQLDNPKPETDNIKDQKKNSGSVFGSIGSMFA